MSNIAVIGAGASGLMAANLVIEAGHSCTLFEAHALPGGCASWFRRATKIGACVFDVGATVVPTFSAGSWWHDKIKSWNLVDDLGYERSQSLRFDIDGQSFNVSCEPEGFFEDLSQAYPSDRAWIMATLKPARDHILKLQNFVETLPQWPIETPKQAWLNLKALSNLPTSTSALKLLLQPFDQWLAGHSLSPDFRKWLEMTALISIQCPLSDAYAMYALFAILFHSTGSGTFEGGMRRYFEILLKRFRSQPGATYLPNTKVSRVNKIQSGYEMQCSNNKIYGAYKKVFLSCPRHLSQQLIYGGPGDRPSQDMWSAMVIYLVVDDDSAWTQGAFNWHIKNSALDEEIFASFSRRGDLSRCPKGFRCITLSHHEKLDDRWITANADKYARKKNLSSERMLQVLKNATGISQIHHQEVATPRTWQKYTNRPMGSVGGLPLSRRWTRFNTPKRFLGSPNLIQIGDTAFPGQSLYSCALSAGMAVKAVF